MGYGKRIRILLLGICASGFVACLMVRLCVMASSAPQSEPISLEMPYQVKDSQIRLLRLTGFEGGYLEDGSLEEVADVAALILENTGEEFTDAHICLETTAGPMEFAAYTIPPHSRLMVLEKNKKMLGTSEILSVEAEVTKLCIRECGVIVSQEGRNTVSVKNTTDHSIADLVVCHKSYDLQADLYLGGITYQNHVTLLLPGETVFLHPAFYASESSKIVCITENALS